MSDELESIDEPTADELVAVDALLARADVDGTLWIDPPADADAAILAAIEAEEAQRPTDIRRRGFTATSWLATAAALVAIVAGITLISRSGDDATVFALEGTERVPEASADVEVAETPVGLKILLTPDRLPSAPEGTYYECWLSNGDVKVSAGTFHLRGGDGEIELWAGVVGPDFSRLAVTLEPIDDDLDSSGDVYLQGTFSIDD
jgi:Anti-sigma-K factor rskA, C-terminal